MERFVQIASAVCFMLITAGAMAEGHGLIGFALVMVAAAGMLVVRWSRKQE